MEGYHEGALQARARGGGARGGAAAPAGGARRPPHELFLQNLGHVSL